MNRPRISLCMIVRDEAAMLPGFLDAAAGVWDELCVVDTGSADATPSLLQAAGARVIRRPWDHDFAAARNASLDLARGEWILFLDADERVTPPLRDGIRAVCADPAAGAATVVLRDDLPGGLRRETRLLRLFRNHPDVRFRHRIHEDVTEAVAAALARTGRTVVDLDGVLEHLGYRPEVAADRDKKARDLALLRRCLDDDPDDWYSAHKLLELARFWRDPELADTLADEFLPRLETAPGALARLRQGGELAVALADARGLRGPERAAWLETWRERVPPSPPLLLELGLTAEQAGDAADAAARYEEAVAAAEAAGPPAAAVRPRLALARAIAAAGDATAALDQVHAALAASPRDPEALTALLGFAAADGSVDRERAFYLREYGDSPAWRRALGEDALRRGRWTEAVTHLEAATDADPPRREDLDLLARARLGAGDRAGARDLAARLLPDLPRAALGVLVCDLIDGRDLDLDVDIDQETADAALRDWLDVLWRSGDTAAMTGLLDRLGLVTDLFPWLPDHLRRLTDRLVGR